jgi:asparagine synthase (glutamine-hydrolysing)
VLLARDRMVEKPLHLVERDGLIAFASELRSLLLMGLVPFVLDPQAVDMYLRYGWVPSPGTIVRGVRELPPAHALAVELDSWSSREGCYWRMDDVAPICGDPVEVLRAELDEVARLTTRADVPIGVALSGGVDSAAVAALATGAHGGTVHAVTVGYEGRPRQDERHAAEGVARALGMAFHSVEVGLSDMVAAFHDLNFVRDVPIADGAGHGYWAISRAARAAGCPVMLQGQGADELFWGYPWVVRALKASTAKQSGADPSRPSVESLRSWLPRSLSSREVFEFVRYLSGVGLGRRRLATCAPGPRDQLVMWDMIDSYQAIDHVGAAIYPLSMRLALAGATPAACFTRARPWGSVDVLMTRVLCGGYLLQNGIRQADRLFMAASVEPRLPLLDYRFVETVVGLRKAASDAALPPKAWFKAAVREVVPQAVLRRPKQGFTPPARAWTEGLRAAYGETLLDGYLVKGGFLRRDAAHLVAQPRGRFSVWSGLLFGLLVLESWCQGVSSMLRGRPLAPPALARPAIQQAAGGQEGH